MRGDQTPVCQLSPDKVARPDRCGISKTRLFGSDVAEIMAEAWTLPENDRVFLINVLYNARPEETTAWALGDMAGRGIFLA